MVRRNHKTLLPVIRDFCTEESDNSFLKSGPAGRAQADQNDSMMFSRNESPRIGEVEILGDQAALFRLCGLPNPGIGLTEEPFIFNRVYIMTELTQI